MNHPLRCRCGRLQGHVVLPATTGRAICYCKDCQAFARFLGCAEQTLDAAGGTDVVAMAPSQVVWSQGLDSLACMSLSPRGLLRWYAGCCATPIGNTPRNRKIHYLGVVHDSLSSRPLEPSFGPATVRVNTASARKPVASTPLATIGVVARLMRTVLPARLTGRYRDNPFFDAATGEPIRPPRVLTAEERAALTVPV